MTHYTWRALDALPTLHQSHTDNLKVDPGTQERGWNEDGDERWWLSRMTEADGEHCDHHVTCERLVKGRWVTVYER